MPPQKASRFALHEHESDCLATDFREARSSLRSVSESINHRSSINAVCCQSRYFSPLADVRRSTFRLTERIIPNSPSAAQAGGDRGSNGSNPWARIRQSVFRPSKPVYAHVRDGFIPCATDDARARPQTLLSPTSSLPASAFPFAADAPTTSQSGFSAASRPLRRIASRPRDTTRTQSC